MITCAITNRHALRGESLMDAIARNLRAGVDWIQIREKDLAARELYHLLRTARVLPNPAGTKFILNSRVDVALAAEADGVHLPSHSPAPHAWHSMLPQDFLIGVSCHTLYEVKQAAAEGASYVFYGPVFAPLSKSSAGSPIGLKALGDATSTVEIPVLALGGITQANTLACVEQGAAGIAGISLFLTTASSC